MIFGWRVTADAALNSESSFHCPAASEDNTSYPDLEKTVYRPPGRIKHLMIDPLQSSRSSFQSASAVAAGCASLIGEDLADFKLTVNTMRPHDV